MQPSLGARDPSHGRPMGGSGRVDGPPTRNRAVDRGPRDCRGRSSSNLVHTGTGRPVRRTPTDRRGSPDAEDGSSRGSKVWRSTMWMMCDGHAHRRWSSHCSQAGETGVHVVEQSAAIDSCGAGLDREQVDAGAHRRGDAAQMGLDLPPQAVAHHSRSDLARQGESDPRWFDRRTDGSGGEGHGHTPMMGATTPTAKLDERAAVTDAPDQADRRARPLRRRERRTFRPARVAMRWRKPCFLARRRLLGWNVRFTLGLLDHRASLQPSGRC